MEYRVYAKIKGSPDMAMRDYTRPEDVFEFITSEKVEEYSIYRVDLTRIYTYEAWKQIEDKRDIYIDVTEEIIEKHRLDSTGQSRSLIADAFWKLFPDTGITVELGGIVVHLSYQHDSYSFPSWVLAWQESIIKGEEIGPIKFKLIDLEETKR